MDCLFDIFSNRELALLAWILILLISFIIKKSQRESIKDVICKFFVFKIIIPILFLIIYVTLIIFGLIKIKFWDINLLKDTIFWFGSTAFVLFFSSIKAENIRFFKDILMDNLKFILILEFLLNLYTLSFVLEFLLLPVLFMLSSSLIFAEYYPPKSKDYSKVVSLLRTSINIIGFFLFVFVIYKSIAGYEDLFSVMNLKALLLPVVFTILTLPFFYFFALYAKYEVLFVVVDNLLRDRDKEDILKIKFIILLLVNISFKRLQIVRSKIGKFAFPYYNPRKAISDMLKEPSYKKSNIPSITKLDLFNDIKKTRYLLSKIGIGNLSEWEFDGVDEYFCMTNYYSFGNSLIGMQNNLAFYLIGGELYIKRLKIVLNINDKSETDLALIKFKDLSIKTLNSLSISISQDLLNSLTNGEEYFDDNITYKLDLVKEVSGIVTLKLIIESK